MTKRVWVELRCPICRHVWMAAMLVPGAWWEVPEERIAKMCYCPACDAPPPMELHEDA